MTNLKQSISTAVLACLVATGWLGTALETRAAAQAVVGTDPPVVLCSNAAAALSGQDPNCAAVTIGGSVVAYPKLQWTPVASAAISQSQGAPSLTMLQGDQTTVLVDRAAKRLGLSGAQLAKSVMLAPSNQPTLFGRYDPTAQTLRVDAYELRKSQDGKTATVLHAIFTPYMGNRWAAGRYYISHSQIRAGVTPGVNPFAAFEGGDNEFHNLNTQGALAAMGLALDYFRAPYAVLAVMNVRLNDFTTTSGGWLRKTSTLHVQAQIQPTYFLLGIPGTLPDAMQAAPVPAFCATDPSSTGANCPPGAVVPPSAAAYVMSGGSFSAAASPLADIYQNSHSGWSFLGITLILLLVAGPLLTTMAPLADALAPGSGGILSLGAGTALGMNLLQGNSNGVYAFNLSEINGKYDNIQLTATGLNGLPVYSTTGGYFAAGSGGASLTNLTASALSGVPSATARYYNMAASLLSVPAVTQNMDAGNPSHAMPYSGAQPIVPPGVAGTLYGSCPPDATLAACAGAPSGYIVRADQYQQEESAQLIRGYP